MTRPAYFFSADLQLYASRADLVRRQPMKCEYSYMAEKQPYGGDMRPLLEKLLIEVIGFVPESGEIPAHLAAQIANAPQTRTDRIEQQRSKVTNKVWVSDPVAKEQWAVAQVPTKPISEKAQAGEQPSFSRYGHPFT